jgi:hypothetical protein
VRVPSAEGEGDEVNEDNETRDDLSYLLELIDDDSTDEDW